MSSARLHRWVGWLTLLAFTGTGIYLVVVHSALIETGGQAMRIAYRSAHIYLFASGLLNLLAAMALRDRGLPAPRPRLLRIGAASLAVSPAALLAGFVVGPTADGTPALLVSAGVVLMALGVFLELAGAKPRKRRLED